MREPGERAFDSEVPGGSEDRAKGVQTWIGVGGPAIRPVLEHEAGRQGETGFQIVTHADGGKPVQGEILSLAPRNIGAVDGPESATHAGVEGGGVGGEPIFDGGTGRKAEVGGFRPGCDGFGQQGKTAADGEFTLAEAEPEMRGRPQGDDLRQDDVVEESVLGNPPQASRFDVQRPGRRGVRRRGRVGRFPCPDGGKET